MKTLQKLKLRTGLVLILLAVGIFSVAAQSKTISGQVTAKNGETLPGVSVVVKGTTQGTITDIDGKFSISVPGANSAVVFSYLGYEPQEFRVGSQSKKDVILKEEVTALNEVVVVGYGVQKKANLTGAVSSMRVNDIKDMPVSNTSSLLQGRMAGVTVTTATSQPGSENDVEIRIRGINTFPAKRSDNPLMNISRNNEPLILIDGVEGLLNSVAPNDIENISVLKDAASASIYGVRAANGVILVTTKRGSSGAHRISYNGSYGIQQATVLPDYINSWQWATLINEENDALGSSTSNYTPDMLQKLKDGSDPDHFANTNWSDEVFRSAPIQNHYLSMTGGGTNSNYLASIGYLNQEGIMNGTNTDRINFRLNADTKYLNVITLGMNAAGSHEETIEPLFGVYNLYTSMRAMRPTIPVKYKNGEWGFYDGNPNMGRIDRNPVYTTSTPSDRISNRFDGKAYIDLEPIKNLHVKSSFAYQYNSHFNSFFSPKYDRYNAAGVVVETATVNKLDESYYYETQWINENILTYDLKTGDNTFNFLLGQSCQYNGYRNSSAYGIDYVNNSIHVLDPALESGAKGIAEEAALRSFFGRINYNYKDRYLVEANIRRDESSRIPKKNRVGYFPSFSAGWNIAQEKFMESASQINALKLRASWGQLGNQNIGYYPFTQYIGLGQNYVWDDIKYPGTAITSLANSDIKWETTTTTNIGLDMVFFNNKFSLTADYYVKATSDILLQLPIPDMVGVEVQPYVNAADIENKGWDIDLGYNDQWGDWTFGARFNISKVKNKVTNVAGKEEWIEGWTINQEGHPINSYYGYVADGLYSTQAEVDAAKTTNAIGGSNLAVGDIKLVDINGDDVITAEDRTIIGNPFPELTYGLNLTTGYKGFDFAAFFQGVSGVDRISMEYPSAGGMVTQRLLDRYSATNNPAGNFPRLGYGGYNAMSSSFWIADASYLRLKNIELGYSFSTSLLAKIKMQRLRMYVSAQNLLTVTDMKDYDPEKYGTDDRGFTYPNAKTISVGLNISF